MSQPPESAATPEYVGPPGTPPGPPPPPGPPAPPRPNIIEIDLSRLPSAATAFGISLVGAAIVMSAAYSRRHGDLDHSTFLVGVLATAGLLAVSAGAHVRMADLDRRAALVSWPGAFGAAGAGVLLGVLLNDGDDSTYYGAMLTLVLSAAGYALSRGGPFVVSAIAAIALLYGKGFVDVVDFGNGDNGLMIAGAGVLFFIVAITAVGWLLPETRVLSAMVAGVGGLYMLTSGFGPFFLFGALAFGGDGGYGGPAHNPYENDIWMLLLYCLVLVLLWSACSVATGFVGFRVLISVLAVLAVPVASFGLAISHPTWWEVGLTVAGGALLAAAGMRALSSRR